MYHRYWCSESLIHYDIVKNDIESEKCQLTPYNDDLVNASEEKIHIKGSMLCTIRFRKFTTQIDALIVDALCSYCLVGVDLLGECSSTKPHVQALAQIVSESKETASAVTCTSTQATGAINNTTDEHHESTNDARNCETTESEMTEAQ